MNTADFARIEKALELRLPDWYRAAFEAYPFPNEEPELFATADEVIRQNQEYRRSGWFDCPWPASFFILGEDGCGNLYFAHLAADDRRIFIADHEGGPEPKRGELDEIVSSDSLAAHIQDTLQVQQQVALRAKARAEKKWWQFWR